MRSYWVISTRLGSMRIIRTSSGVLRIINEVMIELMPELLPAPVAPATSVCGILARSIRSDAPLMSRPTATSIAPLALAASGEVKMSPTATIWRSSFGTSTPIACLPGIGAMMRTSGDAMAYAMSSVRFLILDTLTPRPSSSSKRVTVGPTTMLIRRVSTLCSARARSSTRPRAITASWSTFCAPERCSNDIGGSTHVRSPCVVTASSVSSCCCAAAGAGTTTVGVGASAAPPSWS